MSARGTRERRYQRGHHALPFTVAGLIRVSGTDWNFIFSSSVRAQFRLEFSRAPIGLGFSAVASLFGTFKAPNALSPHRYRDAEFFLGRPRFSTSTLRNRRTGRRVGHPRGRCRWRRSTHVLGAPLDTDSIALKPVGGSEPHRTASRPAFLDVRSPILRPGDCELLRRCCPIASFDIREALADHQIHGIEDLRLDTPLPVIA